MIRTMAAAVLAALLLSLPARAETVDLATVKCSELATMKDDDASFLFAWILGYAGGQAGSTLMDLDSMNAIGADIGNYCADNPDVGLLSAATEILSQ